MKNKVFSSQTFDSEQEMLAFINDSNYKEPISVEHIGDTYKLYYMW